MSERVRRFREGPPKSRQQRAQHAQHALHAQHGQRFQHEIGSPEPLRCSDGSSEDSIQLELEQSADALLRAAQRALQHCSSGSSHSGTAAAMDPGRIRPVEGDSAHYCLPCRWKRRIYVLAAILDRIMV